MRLKALLVTLLALSIVAAPSPGSREKGQNGLFSKKLSKDQKVIHALNRLSFGPRPGDAERVRKMGVEKWIDQQLHPERIAESPALAAKLKPLDSLRMTTVEIAQNYPPPQVIRQIANGRVPFDMSPEQRKIFERLAEREKLRRQGQQAGQMPPPAAQLANLLEPAELRTLRNGSVEEKVQLLASLPNDKRDEVMMILPPPVQRELREKAPTVLRREMLLRFTPQQVVVHDLMEGKLLRAVYSNHQLEEVLADFWYNHFNVFINKGADRYLVTSYERDAVRPHVLGKFKDLLRATAEHPAMLFYLDNWQSVDPEAAGQMGRRLPGAAARRGLNENYARELLELHTMGVDGGYTQKDVVEVARCFTGWTIRNPQAGATFEFNERMHDKREKTVLGVKIPAGRGVEDGLQVLDIVIAHPSTAKYVSWRLAQRFVADNPPPALVAKMAQTFARTEGDIREVMKTMLSSPEFWSEGAYRSKMKSPLEMVGSAVRALDADVDFTATLALKLAELGQPLYGKQEPTGYPNSGEEWVNSTALLARMNFAHALAGNQLAGVNVDPARLVKPGHELDTTRIARALLQTDVSKQTRAAVADGSSPAQLAGLILGSPEFQRH